MADRVGQQFGEYRLMHFLGQGTFGDVYLSKHVYNNTQVAVKVFKTQLTPDKLKDFLNEARTILLKHPNIVPLLDFGIGENDIPFLAMEYASNGTLLQRHPRGTRLPLATVVTYVKQIAAALQYAHDQRRIHRDVKPENMLFGANNEILLSDFGIAVVAHSPSSQRTEDVIGTAHYMAPEQWRGKPLPATDQYALGIMVYEWLCGEYPFVGDSLQLSYKHTYVSPPPLHEKAPTIVPEVEQVVLRALAKEPTQRFANVMNFASALEQAYQAEQASTFVRAPSIPIPPPPPYQPQYNAIPPPQPYQAYAPQPPNYSNQPYGSFAPQADSKPPKPSYLHHPYAPPMLPGPRRYVQPPAAEAKQKRNKRMLLVGGMGGGAVGGAVGLGISAVETDPRVIGHPAVLAKVVEVIAGVILGTIPGVILGAIVGAISLAVIRKLAGKEALAFSGGKETGIVTIAGVVAGAIIIVVTPLAGLTILVYIAAAVVAGVVAGALVAGNVRKKS